MCRLPILLLTASSLWAEPSFRLQPGVAKLSCPAITEASGLAVSPTDPRFLWIINDSGGGTEIHLTETDGTARGSVTMRDAENRDWEDLASFTLGGKPYLLIADTGDNESKRESCMLYIIPEPQLPPDGGNISGKTGPAREIRFTYEDGPRDCEAVAVDPEGGKIILVSKRTDPPGVYELPLAPAKHPIARKVGTTGPKAGGLVLPIAFRNQPTGMDISADGGMAAIVTYHGVFVFRRAKGATWADAISVEPLQPGAHGLAQAEAVAISRDGKTIFAVSEKANSPIVRYCLAE
ncbi:hypothetical protein HZ994_04645 [Akkermansiaceae bacterium]|nr:hypothetical protein HZ994_04645 [Akkermansiaceae bacterium]